MLANRNLVYIIKEPPNPWYRKDTPYIWQLWTEILPADLSRTLENNFEIKLLDVKTIDFRSSDRHVRFLYLKKYLCLPGYIPDQEFFLKL